MIGKSFRLTCSNKYLLLVMIFFIHINIQAKSGVEEVKESIKNLNSNRKNFLIKENIKRSDSAIYIAKKSKDKELISNSYLEKARYLYGLKSYAESLKNYIEAEKYTSEENTNYTIKFGIALIKHKLGDYKEALELYNSCENYFKNNQNSLDNKKGYAATLGRKTILYLQINNLKDAQTNQLLHLKNTIDKYDSAYSIKNQGLIHFKKKEYQQSEDKLMQSLPIIIENQDYYWIAYIYQTLGIIYYNKNELNKSLEYFNKVVKIIDEHNIYDTEFKISFDYIIKMNQQLNTNHNIDFLKLYSNYLETTNKSELNLQKKIFKEYDESNLKRLNNQKLKFYILIFSIILSFSIIALIVYYNIKQRKIKQKVDEILAKSSNEVIKINRSKESENIALEEKIKEFEFNKQFLDHNLTIQSLADILQTNRTYLSRYINDSRNMNFRKYINSLRIAYIINELNTDHRLLNLNLDGLAEKAGFKSRQIFSNAFLDYTGIRPNDFLKNLK